MNRLLCLSITECWLFLEPAFYLCSTSLCHSLVLQTNIQQLKLQHPGNIGELLVQWAARNTKPDKAASNCAA